MRAALSALSMILLVGCAPLERTVRTERGPLLRSFTRSQVLPGSLHGQVRVEWPAVQLRVVETEVCRQVSVDEYVEDVVTERTFRAAGPALSTGLTLTVGAGVLFGLSFLSSPNPGVDAQGRSLVAPRAVMQGWSLASLILGVPSLAVGIVGFLRSGEEVEHRRVEQETSQHDADCHQREVSGPVQLRSEGAAEVGTVVLVGGKGAIAAPSLGGTPAALNLAGKPVTLDDVSQDSLAQVGACLEADAQQGALEEMGEAALQAQVRRLRQCHAVRSDVLERLQLAERVLSRRREP